jgi:hypothetical protein
MGFIVSVSQRSWVVAVLISLTCALSCGALGAFPTTKGASFSGEGSGHALLSFSMAASRADCPDRRLRMPFYVRVEEAAASGLLAQLFDIRILDLPSRLDETAPKLCAQDVGSVTNNENTLMLLMQVALTMWPNATLSQLADVLLWMKVAALLFFVTVLARIGVPVLAVFGSLLLALVILRASNRGVEFTLYPFLMPALVSYVGAVVLVSQQRTPLLCALSYIALGLVCGVLMNLRSSYIPVWFGLVVLAGLLQWRTLRGRVTGAIACAVLFFGSAIVVHNSIVNSAASNSNFNYSHHPIGHPLLLGLAVPENPFAASEGIVWSDAAGIGIARRIDPTVEYLDQKYDRALITYYFKLWREHPREMMKIYRLKVEQAGLNAFPSFLDDKMSGTLLTRFYAPIRTLRSGSALVAILLGAFGVLLVLRWKRDDTRLTACVLIVAATLSLLVEQMAIMTYFDRLYHSSLLLLLGLVLIGIYWLACEVAVKFARRAVSVPRVVGTKP